MNRLVLSDAAWERMAPLIIGRPDQKGSTGREIGCSWKACLGSFVRALPGVICMKHSGIGTVYPSLQSLEPQGGLVADFEAMSDDPDFEYLIVDSTIVRAHQHAAKYFRDWSTTRALTLMR